MQACPNCGHSLLAHSPMPWLDYARQSEGEREVPGRASNPWIMGLWASADWIWSTVSRRDDSVLPWCGAYVHDCLSAVGIESPKHWYRAKAYIDFGIKLYQPTLGAIAVIKNSRGRYHVGFIVGRNHAGHVMLLGGNQNDSVSVAAFTRDSLEYIGWPGDVADIPNDLAPILSAALSVSEA